MLSAGTLLCVHASFPFLVNVVCGGHICSHCGHIWFCHVCGFGGILRRAEHGEVLYVPFGVFVLQLTYRSLCFEQLFVSNSERFKHREYLQHYSFKWCRFGCTIVSANVQQILILVWHKSSRHFWSFPMTISDPLWGSSLITFASDTCTVKIRRPLSKVA